VIYHVGSRSVDHRPIFCDAVPRDSEKFVGLLARTVEQYGWRLYAYCVMRNHFHLIVQTPFANLSAGMQHLKSRYAIWFNYMVSREGALWERRFWDRISDDEGALIERTRYVVLNPVRAGLVDRPDAWPASSYCATVGIVEPASFLDVDGVLAWYGGGPRARIRFAEFVGAAIPPRKAD
jgi:putative transposase